jgi:hypothetical protein
MKQSMIPVVAVAACLAAAPAHATGDITCSGAGEDVSIDMLVGRLQVLSILRAVIRIGEETWSTDQSYAQGTPITIGQGFEDDRHLVVDFTDAAVSETVGKLRAFALSEGDDYRSGGVFSLKDKGVFLVDCSLRG